MAIKDFNNTTEMVAGLVRTTTATDNTAPTPYQYDFLEQQKLMELEKTQVEQEALIRKLMVDLQYTVDTPFEETDDFRDFVVWLCGFTEGHAVPDKKQWEMLRERTKKIAAKFALKARDRVRENLRERYDEANSIWNNSISGAAPTLSPLTSSGISGSETLMGNEELLTGATYAKLGTSTKTTY